MSMAPADSARPCPCTGMAPPGQQLPARTLARATTPSMPPTAFPRSRKSGPSAATVPPEPPSKASQSRIANTSPVNQAETQTEGLSALSPSVCVSAWFTERAARHTLVNQVSPFIIKIPYFLLPANPSSPSSFPSQHTYVSPARFSTDVLSSSATYTRSRGYHKESESMRHLYLRCWKEKVCRA